MLHTDIKYVFELKQQLAERLQKLNIEIGEQVRGQERAIIIGINEKPYDKLNSLSQKFRDNVNIKGCQMIGVGSINRLIFTP